MYTTIFRNNEINTLLFNNNTNILYKYKIYNDVSELKDEKYGNFIDLDITKSKIDELGEDLEQLRIAASKYYYEYELIKTICRKHVISRAYFKLYEILYDDPILLLPKIDCFFICEAPGGFIECLNDIRRQSNLHTNYITVSKIEGDVQYSKYLEISNIIYGDITTSESLNNIIKCVKEKYPNGMDIITADGGFNIKNFNSQEVASSKLILCEIYLALMNQKINGLFVIKFFDMFTHNSIISYLILCSFYKYVKIIKPITSRSSNSERYLVCYNFLGVNNDSLELINKLKIIINNFIYIESNEYNKQNITTIIFPEFNFYNINNNNLLFYKKISNFNNIILKQQIENINNSINLVNNKKYYFNNIIIKIFNNKNHIPYIEKYSLILQYRIKLCSEWLLKHKIPIIYLNGYYY